MITPPPPLKLLNQICIDLKNDPDGFQKNGFPLKKKDREAKKYLAEHSRPKPDHHQRPFSARLTRTNTDLFIDNPYEQSFLRCCRQLVSNSLIVCELR